MSTHLHNPLAEMSQALRTFRGFMLAGAASVTLWSVIFVAVLAVEYGIGVR